MAPVAEATSPGTSPVTLTHVAIPGLLQAGVVTDTADATDASSKIANVRLNLAPLMSVRVRAVTSSCTFNPNTGTVSGDSSLVGGHVSAAVPTVMPVHPARNRIITIPGVATITLNRQTTAPDGTLTVDAIYVRLLGTSQTLTVATSVCNAASLAPVPVLPGRALPIGLGGLGVLMLGGLGYQFSRRRRQAAAA